MQKRISLGFVVLFVVLSLLGCSHKKSDNTVVDTSTEQYDWAAARESFVKEIMTALEVITAGEMDDYRMKKTEWSVKVSSSVVHSSMFQADPPVGCSAAVRYMGYSAPEYNSQGAEYIQFTVRRMNNTTLASVDWQVILRLGKGTAGYYVEEYIQEGMDE